MMRRRSFITLLGGAAGAWPLVARAQQSRKLPTIGFLGSATSLARSHWVAAFVQRLHELGWVEGRTAMESGFKGPAAASPVLSACLPGTMPSSECCSRRRAALSP